MCVRACRLLTLDPIERIAPSDVLYHPFISPASLRTRHANTRYHARGEEEMEEMYPGAGAELVQRKVEGSVPQAHQAKKEENLISLKPQINLCSSDAITRLNTCGLDNFSSKMEQLAEICKLQLEHQNRLVKGTAVEANKAALDKPSTGGKLTPKTIGIQHAHCSLYSSKMQAKDGTDKVKVPHGSCPSSFAPSQVLFLQRGKRRDVCSEESRGPEQAKQDGCPDSGQPCIEVPRYMPLSSAGLPPELPALSQPVQPNSVQSSLPLLLSKQFICLSPPAGSHAMALSPVAIHQLQPLSLSKTFPLSVVTPIYPGQVVTLQQARAGPRPLMQEQVSDLSSSSPSQPGQPLTFISFQQVALAQARPVWHSVPDANNLDKGPAAVVEEQPPLVSWTWTVLGNQVKEKGSR
uniref:uncharacterized protein n=1 Tax=Myxine glutinosa TaxID=7769 RepID=UPI00358F1CE9